MRICNKCFEEQPEDCFYTNGKYTRNKCKICIMKDWCDKYRENREKILLNKRQNYNNNLDLNRKKARDNWKKNRDKISERRKLDYKNNTEVYKFRRIKYLYGMSKEDVYKKFLEQEDKCGICNEVFSITPNIDHDHSSGKVRMLLCNHCNRGLGAFKDSIDNLIKAAMYLEKFKER